jgi:hypothetical protein
MQILSLSLGPLLLCLPKVPFYLSAQLNPLVNVVSEIGVSVAFSASNQPIHFSFLQAVWLAD